MLGLWSMLVNVPCTVDKKHSMSSPDLDTVCYDDLVKLIDFWDLCSYWTFIDVLCVLIKRELKFRAIIVDV